MRTTIALTALQREQLEPLFANLRQYDCPGSIAAHVYPDRADVFVVPPAKAVALNDTLQAISAQSETGDDTDGIA